MSQQPPRYTVYRGKKREHKCTHSIILITRRARSPYALKFVHMFLGYLLSPVQVFLLKLNLSFLKFVTDSWQECCSSCLRTANLATQGGVRTSLSALEGMVLNSLSHILKIYIEIYSFFPKLINSFPLSSQYIVSVQ